MFSYTPPEKRLNVTPCQSEKIRAQNEIMNSLVLVIPSPVDSGSIEKCSYRGELEKCDRDWTVE
jgi:hypothetical protein